MGLYLPVMRSSRIATRKSVRPACSMSANVWPSMPGAPPFLLAARYASSRVSVLVTCTKRPQKRCDLSDFAFRYIRLRRSCRLIGAFVISPLPHFVERNTYRSGPFPPDAFCCTSINGSTTRSAPLTPASAFPTRGYSSRLLDEISSPGAEGFSSCHILLLTMSSLIPRRREPPHRTHFDRLLLLSHVIDSLSLRIRV